MIYRKSPLNYHRNNELDTPPNKYDSVCTHSILEMHCNLRHRWGWKYRRSSLQGRYLCNFRFEGWSTGLLELMSRMLRRLMRSYPLNNWWGTAPRNFGLQDRHRWNGWLLDFEGKLPRMILYGYPRILLGIRDILSRIAWCQHSTKSRRWKDSKDKLPYMFLKQYHPKLLHI